METGSNQEQFLTSKCLYENREPDMSVIGGFEKKHKTQWEGNCKVQVQASRP